MNHTNSATQKRTNEDSKSSVFTLALQNQVFTHRQLIINMDNESTNITKPSKRGQYEPSEEKPDEFTPDYISSLSEVGVGVSQVLGLSHTSAVIDIFTPESRAMVVDSFLNTNEQPTTMSGFCEDHPVTKMHFSDHIDILAHKYHIVRDLGEIGDERLYQLNTENPLVQLCMMGNDIYQTGTTEKNINSNFLV